MNARNREDALLRSLDQLSPGDPAASDPCLVKNPDLMEEARTAREAAVEVWLAAAPLQMAPPGALGRLMSEVRSTPVDAAKAPDARRRWAWPHAAAAAGWAAALVLGGLLVSRGRPGDQVREGAGNSPHGDTGRTPLSRDGGVPGASPGSRISSPSERRNQEEIARLKKTLEEQERQGVMPWVRSLSAPGAVAVSPERARDDLHRMLFDALRSSLEVETGAPGDSAALVIERGWLPAGFPPLQEGQTIRHRHFPEDNWQDYGLAKSPEGEYYDARNSLLWARDPEGRGFIGHLSPAPDAAAGFKTQPDEVTDPQPQKKATPQTKSQFLAESSSSGQNRPVKETAATSGPASQPAGILIDDPVTLTTSAIIEGLPIPTNGAHYVLFSTSDGRAATVLVDASMYTNSGALIVSSPFNLISSSSWNGGPTVSAGVPNFSTNLSLEFRDTSGKYVQTLLQSASNPPR